MNERGGCQGFHLLVFSARTVKGDILSLFIRKLPAATSHIYYWQTLIHHSNLGWISMERNLHQFNRFSFKNWCQIIPFACCILVWRLFVCLHLREVGSSSGKCNNALDWEAGTKMLMKPVKIYCSQYQCVCRKYYFYWERESEWDSPSKLPLPPFVAFAQRKMWKICSGNHCLVKILFPRQLLRETTLLWGEQIFDRNYFQRWTNILTNIWQKLLWMISEYLTKII